MQRLQKEEVPPGIDIIDGGRAGAGIRFVIEDRRKIIFIDAGDFKGEPGEWVRFTPDQVRSLKTLPSLSFHGFDLISYIQGLEEEYAISETVIYCIQPLSLDPGDRLSGPVSQGLDSLIESLLIELKQ